VALQSLDNRQYIPCCGGCFHFLGAARHHLMVRPSVCPSVRPCHPTLHIPARPAMANQSTHSAFLQLLAEATDRSALSGPDSAAAQAEEAALFPDASFSPFVPCAMVRACLRACVDMRFHAHRSTESILPFCVPTKKTKGLRRAVLLPHLPRRALGPGPPPPVRGARPRARGREPPLGPVQDPRRYVARRSSLHPAPAPAWPRSDLSSAWPPFPSISHAAVRTNEIFLLVADVVALVLTRAEANGGDLQAALEVSLHTK